MTQDRYNNGSYVPLPDEPSMEVESRPLEERSLSATQRGALLLKEQPARLPWRLTDWQLGSLLLLVVVTIGLVAGLTLPGSTHLGPGWHQLHNVLGFTYTAAWSISFYPQVISNWQRRSVEGLSTDFLYLNLLGFICYSLFNCVLYWQPHVRCEAAPTACTGPVDHPHLLGSPPRVVDLNDVVFGLHAVAITLVTLGQVIAYRHTARRVSRPTVALLVGSTLALAGYAALVALVGESGPPLTYLSVLYAASFVKMGLTLVKYIPQVVLNYRRKTTVGWSIWNVLLDFMGGVLSLAQMILKSTLTHDWSVVTHNPVKFGLGFSSMFFDAIFIAQHYVLYPNGGSSGGPLEPLEAAASAGDSWWAASTDLEGGAGSIGGSESAALLLPSALQAGRSDSGAIASGGGGGGGNAGVR